MLAAMSPSQRKAFLAVEALQRAALQKQREEEHALREVKLDERAAIEAKHQIAIAKSEGRKYARVWVSKEDTPRVLRWAFRQSYTALKVKEGNRSTDIQISISGF